MKLRRRKSGRVLQRTTWARGQMRNGALKEFRPHIRLARLDNPTRDEILDSLKGMFCAWCDDRRTFKALGAHWFFAHGMYTQEVRDLLGVKKRTPFICEALRHVMSLRAKRLYPEHKATLVPKKGVKRVLSKFGIESQRKKWENLEKRLGPEGMQKQRLAANVLGAAANHAKYLDRAQKTCIICGQDFFRPAGSSRALTCGDVCEKELHIRDGKRRFSSGILANTPIGKRKLKTCPNCKKVGWWSNRGTCSEECRHTLVSRNSSSAMNRDKLRRMSEAHAEYLASLPKRLCTMEGCTGKHVGRGLCKKHYRQAFPHGVPEGQRRKGGRPRRTGYSPSI